MREGNSTSRVHTMYERKESDHMRREKPRAAGSDTAQWAADVGRGQRVVESGQTECSGSGQEQTGKGTDQGQWDVPLQDDTYFGGPNKELVIRKKDEFKKKWECRDQGETKEFLGIHISHIPGGFSLQDRGVGHCIAWHKPICFYVFHLSLNIRARNSCFSPAAM